MPARSRNRMLDPVIGEVTEFIDGVDISTTPTIDKQRSEVMNDFVTPNYRSRIKAGEIINNDASYTSSTIDNTTGGSYTATHVGGRKDGTYGSGCQSAYWASRGYAPAFLDLTIDLDQSIAEAKSRAIADIDSTPYSFAEDVGEIRETLLFLTGTLKALNRPVDSFYRYVRRLRESSPKITQAQAIAEAWAIYRFAISPLIRSGHDLLEAQTAKVVRPERRTARGFVEIPKRSVSEKGVIHPPHPSFRWNLHTTGELLAKAGILYEVSNPVIDWRFKYGLRFKDIPTTLWAITPYSFMVDRVSNISNTITGLVNFLDPQVKFLTAWYTTKYDRSFERSFVNQVIPSSAWSVSVSPDTQKVREFAYNRVVWAPTAIDTVSPLNLKGLVDSTTKVADLLALITLRLKG